MKILENQLSRKMESIDPADTEQIEQIVRKELIAFLKEKQDMKYNSYVMRMKGGYIAVIA